MNGRSRILMISAGVVVAVGAVTAVMNWQAAAEKKDLEARFAAARVDAVPASTGFEYTVPKPGDPNYEDYQEMLAQPRFRSWMDNSPGYALPYDPEWRSVLTGRRETGPTDLEFARGGTLKTAIGKLLEAFEERHSHVLIPYEIGKDEFELILWPEFPQSRPYVKIPPDEAWLFRKAKYQETIREGMGHYAGMPLDLVDVKIVKTDEYTNFRLVTAAITARDRETGETLELKINPILAERHGKYAFMSFNE